MDANRALAEARVGEPVIAGAFFRVRWDGELRGAGLFSLVFTFLSWVVPRIRSRLPSNAYLAVTASDVYALEFRFGPPRIERVVARWPRTEVQARTAGENRYSVDVTVDGRDIELEALTYNDDSAAVVDALIGRS